ncbi:sensor domain-containing diguanylate cyclase [Clostridium sp. AM58-1XD]|uniref:sensor domain-containing diguanylate cyclase n=1 Tax=Clostridium sp. AM58-1XD TaxID=2292307 RepID=UPI000E494490|nr:sensor domain-containing diguanylate cyclase [Clostridium sp. AM58-1XD]RGY96847.1 diguanylate cyclase [Clostridium sp. AM58-1XD]
MGRFDKAPDIAEDMLRAYFCTRDWEGAAGYFCSRTDMIRMSGNVSFYDQKSMKEIFRIGIEDMPPCSITDMDLRLTREWEDSCLVTGSCCVVMDEPGTRFFQCILRITLFFVLDSEGNLKIFHQHVSVPSDPLGEEERKGRIEYEQMKDDLEEKTAQIEMIARTAAGGLKGSLDDPYYTYFYVNHELCQMLGYTYEEFMEMSGGTAVGAVYPPDLPKALNECRICFEKGPEYRAEYRIRKKDGSLLWVLDTGRKVTNARGQTIINSIITDISDMKEAYNQLKIEQERYEIVAELSDETIFEYDIREDSLQMFYPSSTPGKRHTDRFDQFGKTWEILFRIHPDDAEEVRNRGMAALQQSGAEKFDTVEYRILLEQGGFIWKRAVFRGVHDTEGKIAKIVGKVKDINEEKRILFQSQRDVLTGAYNRMYLELSIREYLKRKMDGVVGVCILVDIDYFKIINDYHGHLTGDQVLMDLVGMMYATCRCTDIISRIGGDEFVIFMKDIFDLDIVKEKLDWLLCEMKKYGAEKRISVPLTFSAGIVTAKKKRDTFSSLYRKADIALYHAKAEGRERYILYQKGMEYPQKP